MLLNKPPLPLFPTLPPLPKFSLSLSKNKPTMASSSSSWPCPQCTFINDSPSHRLHCKMCDNPNPSSPAAGRVLPCRQCTFNNPVGAVSCEMCRVRAPHLVLDLDPDPIDLSDPAVGPVFLPLRRCNASKRPAGPAAKAAEAAEERRRAGKAARVEAEELDVVEVVPSSPLSEHDGLSSNWSTIKILSYNVWFREDVEVCERMKALGDLIQQHSPDLICFQEVTPLIYKILQSSKWWKAYKCSLSQGMEAKGSYFCMQMSKLPVKRFSCKPFSNSIMGRELCLANIDVGMGKTLDIATSHLESPSPGPPRWDQMYSAERVAQAKESLGLLKDLPNVIFCGDMNWDDKLDGPFPVPDGWVDAWMLLKPGENGWTYDTKANPMLSANRTLQKRLDRFICKLQDFKISSIEMIGKEAIPGVSYFKEKKVRKEFQKLVLPVLPSDHYGLLLTVTSL